MADESLACERTLCGAISIHLKHTCPNLMAENAPWRVHHQYLHSELCTIRDVSLPEVDQGHLTKNASDMIFSRTHSASIANHGCEPRNASVCRF